VSVVAKPPIDKEVLIYFNILTIFLNIIKLFVHSISVCFQKCLWPWGWL